MKFLLIFSMLLLCAPAFSNDFSGTTWALVGVGCRDASLSERSHVSKSLASGDVTAGILHFADDTNVNMTVTLRGKEQSRSGTYRVNRENIVIRSGQEMTVPIVGRELVLVGSRTESVQECCPAKHVRGWREHKKSLQDREAASSHSGGTTWEEEKAKRGWEEEWLADSKEEFDRLKTRCQQEKPFVYVLEEV